jgi:hypothetical protein
VTQAPSLGEKASRANWCKQRTLHPSKTLVRSEGHRTRQVAIRELGPAAIPGARHCACPTQSTFNTILVGHFSRLRELKLIISGAWNSLRSLQKMI